MAGIGQLDPASPPDGEEKQALQGLARGFRGSLFRYFSRRARDPGEIEDMVQEVLIRLIRRGNVAQIENLSGYVFETASCVLKDRERKSRIRCAREHVSFDLDRHGGVDFSPERVLSDREQLARAVAALLELPERTRVIFVLRRLEGMRYKDIADRLGISVSAIEKHMQKAVLHLAGLQNR
ncbi:MAG: RNA polymerase sigma factor [Sphingobium sp.]